MGILQARTLDLSFYTLIQGIFPTQGLNQDLLHCRWILYQLSYQRSPFIIVVFPLYLREFPYKSWKTSLVEFNSFSFSVTCKIFDLPMKSEQMPCCAFLIVSFSLSVLSINHTTPFWPAESLLKSQLRDYGSSLVPNLFLFLLLSISLVQSLSCVYLWPHGLQHARSIIFPSPTPRACSNSCPLNWLYHTTISSSVVPFSCLQSFPASGSSPVSQFFLSGGQSIGTSALESFSSEYSELMSFRMDWLDLLAGQGTLKSLLQHHSSSSALSFLYGPTLTSIHNYWKNHSFDYIHLCWQSNVSAF